MIFHERKIPSHIKTTTLCEGIAFTRKNAEREFVVITPNIDRVQELTTAANLESVSSRPLINLG